MLGLINGADQDKECCVSKFSKQIGLSSVRRKRTMNLLNHLSVEADFKNVLDLSNSFVKSQETVCTGDAYKKKLLWKLWLQLMKRRVS